MANTLNRIGSTSGTDPNQLTASSTSKTEVSKDLFLKLMIAQLKNQNPLNPSDGAEFLTQLSQISSVEQMVEVRQQVTAIRNILAGQAPDATDDKTGAGTN